MKSVHKKIWSIIPLQSRKDLTELQQRSRIIWRKKIRKKKKENPTRSPWRTMKMRRDSFLEVKGRPTTLQSSKIWPKRKHIIKLTNQGTVKETPKRFAWPRRIAKNRSRLGCNSFQDSSAFAPSPNPERTPEESMVNDSTDFSYPSVSGLSVILL